MPRDVFENIEAQESRAQAEQIRDRADSAYAGVRAPTGAALAFRCDDSYAEDVTILADLQSRNLPYGMGTIRANIDQPGRVTAAQLADLFMKGGEVMAHEDGILASLAAAEGKSPVEWYRDHILLNDVPYLRSLGYPVDAFVQPGTWTGNDYIDTPEKAVPFDALTRAHLAASNAYVIDDTLGNISLKSLPAQRKYWRSYKGIDNDTLANNQALIDELVKYGGTLDFVFHSWRINTPTFLTLTDFRALLDYVVTLRDAGKLDVLTPTGLVYAQRGPDVNLLRNSGFEEYALGAMPSTSPLIWQLNGSPTVVAGGRTGVALQVTDTNYAFQHTTSVNGLRNVEFTGWAKLGPASPAGARLVFRTQGVGGGQIQNWDQTTANGALPTITDSGWTKIRKVYGVDNRARQMRIQIFATAGATVLWDDLQLRKI